MLVKRISDSWQRPSSREEQRHPDTSATEGLKADGAGRRWWRLNDSQMQLMRYLVLLLAVGVVLMSLTSRETRDAGTSPTDGASTPSPVAPVVDGGVGPAADYARAVERQVTEALLQLHGVGRVHVAVTVSAGIETVLAEHVTTERRITQAASGPGTVDDATIVDERTTAQPVLVRSDQNRQEHPIVLVERSPVIQGVVVVTDAAADSRMRYEISRAVVTLLGLPVHRVYVLPQRW